MNAEGSTHDTRNENMTFASERTFFKYDNYAGTLLEVSGLATDNTAVQRGAEGQSKRSVDRYNTLSCAYELILYLSIAV